MIEDATENDLFGNPFPGLRPFEESDNVLFFGRDSQIDALLARLEVGRFVAVVGTSASGKSSLVRAGLLPALRGGFMAGAGSRWRVAVFSPGSAPTANLAAALEGAGVLGAEGTNALRTGLAQAVLEGGERGLIEVVKQAHLRTDENVLVIVDQFEELFRYAQDHDGAAAFVKLLLAAAAEPSVPIYVLITMRSDFLGDCAQFRDLPETINDGLFLVPRLTREELREVIAGPVGVVDGEISPLLVNRLLNEIDDSPDQLPVLQHALMRTWEHWTDRGSNGVIDVDDFDATGGLAHALSNHGDALYAGLPERLRPVAEKLFKALTDAGTDERGIRRATPFAQLPGIIGVPEEDVRAVIEVFRGSGRSFVMPPSQELDDTTIIDIAHESLMRVWGRLQAWVKEEAESTQTYRRLADAAQLYAKGEGALLVDPQLTIAANWRAHNEPTAEWAERNAPGFVGTMVFLEASLAERERQRQEEVDRQRREREEERRALEAEEAARRAVLERETAVERERAAASAEITRRTRGYLYVVSVVAVIAIALGVYSVFAKNAEHAAQAATVINTTHFFASVAADKVDQGDAAEGMSLALHVLPTSAQPGQPFVQEAEYALEDAVANLQERRDFVGHDGPVNSAAYSPDGTQIVSVSNNDVHVWNIAAGTERHFSAGLKDSTVRSAAYSPDGRRIVSASFDNTLRVWDATSFKQIALIKLTGHVYSAAYSPRDGRRIVTASDDVRVWDATSFKLVKVLSIPGLLGVNSAEFSPDGSRIVSAYADGSVRIWNPATGSALALQTGSGASSSNLAAFSPDGTRIVTASDDKTVRVWNATTGAQTVILRGHEAPVNSATFSPNGQQILTAAADHTIRIWDAASGAQLAILRGHYDTVSSATYSRVGDQIASGSHDGTVRLWSTAIAAEIAVLPHAQGVESASFSPDGRRVATASDDKIIRIWDTTKASQLNPPLILRGHAQRVNSVAFSPDGRRLASASYDKTVRIWDARSGALLGVLNGHEGPVNSAVFSPDGMRVVSASDDDSVRIWDATKFTLIKQLNGHTTWVYSAAFSPDGRSVVSGSFDDTVRRWDATSGAQIAVLKGHRGHVLSVAYSPDGKLIVSASADQTARVWDATAGDQDKPLFTLRGHEDTVNSAGFSPDGRRIVTASGDRTVRIWDASLGSSTTGVQIALLRGHEQGLNSAAFSPDGLEIVSASDDATVRIWSMPLRDKDLIDAALRLQPARPSQQVNQPGART